jgi:hypothetical protein
MYRLLVAAAGCLALAACGQSSTSAVPGWTHEKSAEEVSLSIVETPDMAAFRLVCAKAGPALTLSAGVQQVGMANMAPPFAMTLSGAPFPATLVPGQDGGPTFAVTAPLTAEMLTAVRDGTTARISVNDGYAFAESGVDQGQEFEKFAADCTALTGVAAQ